MRGNIKSFILASFLGIATVVNASNDRPNFLFIIVDDLGWADIGVNGSTFYETPNIDRLASEGVLFTESYVASPMCSPTRASIMTGKHPARLHMTNWIGAPQPEEYKWNTILRSASYVEALPLEEVTLAESMNDAGYETYFIGKWHLGKQEKYWPEHQGFKTNIAGCAWGAPVGGNKYFSPYDNPRLEDGPEGEHLPDRLAKETITFLEKDHNRPFFAFLSFYSVHSPWMAREDLKVKYEKKEKPQDEWRQERWIRFAKTQNNPVYAAMIEAMDMAIGDVLGALKKTGLDKNTVVVFISDNGGASEVTSNAPLRAGKCFLYEGGIRVPMILSWPGQIKAGSVTDIPVTSTDFYPTILDIAGIPKIPEQHLDGNSFAALLKRENYSGKDLFWHYPHYEGGYEPSSAIRSGDWKLIEFYEEGRIELYNLNTDIGEYHNLAEMYPEKVQMLREKLNAWRKEVNASEPTPNPNFNPFETQNYRIGYESKFKKVNDFKVRNR
jgi:arylsulfatase A-like enzyme